MINLQEAFSKLNMMESSQFELLDDSEKDAMKNFLEDDELEAEPMEIIDPQAEEESELEDSYVGKIIVQCPVCKSLLYKSEDEIAAEGDEEQQCPYCFSIEKFDLIGKVVPMEDETAPEEVPAEDPEAMPMEEGKDCCPECGKNPCECEKKIEECDDGQLKEDLESVSIETEDQVITVNAEDKAADAEPAIEAEPEQEEVVDAEPEESHEDAEIIAPLDDEEGMDIDEIDEDSFDEFAESFLRENYKNIKSYKTSSVKDCGKYALAEGIVTLANGDARKTQFKIRPAHFNKEGNGSCLVENLQLKKRAVVRSSVK